MRRFFAAVAGVLLAMPAAIAAEAPTQTLHVALREDGDMLDPTLARTYVGRIVFAGLCDKLFDLDAKLGIVPQLATGYEWADSRTLVLHIRPGVLFQDGTRLDATAVKYSLMRHLTMPGSSRRGEIAAMTGVDVVDPLTLRIHLSAPNAPFLSQLTDRAGMIVSPRAAEAEGKNFALHPVCAGPFSFVERVAQDHITLDRFPGYWNAAAIHFARVIYQPIVNSSVRLAALQAGSIDLAENVAPSDVATVKADHKLKLYLSETLGYVAIGVNLANGPRGNSVIGHSALVRQALSLAIDRKALVQVVYNGMYAPIAQAVPDNSPFYAKSVPPPARDVAKAKALLKQAGVALPVKLDMIISNSPDQQQLGEVIQSMAAEAGFAIKLQTMEFASAISTATHGDYQMFLNGWSGRPDADGNLWNFVHSGAPLNDTGYANPQVDGWLEAAREALDMPTRVALYARIARQLDVDLPHIYLYAPMNTVAMTTRLHGFAPVPDGMIRLQSLRMDQ
jgi:peptide/nickel transport system substrate-binding protein